jgi:long-subunit acyl-CoA synthetase (AMP-forming)
MAEQPYIDQLLERIRARGEHEAFVWRGKPVTYAEFDAIISSWIERLKAEGIGQGDCVGVLADY